MAEPWIFSLIAAGRAGYVCGGNGLGEVKISGEKRKSPECEGAGRVTVRDVFDKGKRAAGLGWVRGFHELRHFRATMWLQHGVDIHTVQRYLGHQRIETTMRYLHFVEDYAEKAVRKAQELEQQEAAELDLRGRQLGDAAAVGSGSRKVEST